MRVIKFIGLLFFLLLNGCSDHGKNKNQIITVTARSYSNTLFYSGTIQPLSVKVIPSPADGAVIDMPFQYGEEIKQDQLLFVLSSTKFLTDYKSALMQYIKAKNDFNNTKTILTEGTFLHKNELISDDDFKMKQSNYYAAQLALLQAKDTLGNLLHQLNIKDVDLYKLTIADIDKITAAMHLQINSEDIRILAESPGIILAPSKNDDEFKKIYRGDSIKQGEALAVIGDMSGLSVRIKVNELTVNQLTVGQTVRISGVAFPGEVLNGEIKRIDRQAEASGGGLPNFSVDVIVPKLTPEQQKVIHVGMSAKVEIDLTDKPKIMIPMQAVQEYNGTPSVKLYDEKTKQTRDATIATGKTTLDSVVVLAGLKPGDKIVIPS